MSTLRRICAHLLDIKNLGDHLHRLVQDVVDRELGRQSLKQQQLEQRALTCRELRLIAMYVLEAVAVFSRCVATITMPLERPSIASAPPAPLPV